MAIQPLGPTELSLFFKVKMTLVVVARNKVQLSTLDLSTFYSLCYEQSSDYVHQQLCHLVHHLVCLLTFVPVSDCILKEY